MALRLIWLLATCTLLAIGSVTSAAERPEDVVTVYFHYLQEGRWESLAKLYDPADLRAFKEAMMPIMETPVGAELLISVFGLGATLEEVRTATDAAFFAAHLRSWLSDAIQAELEHRDFEIIGSVPEGDDLVHVLVRYQIETEGFERVEQMQVVSLRSAAGRWVVSMDDGVMKSLVPILQRRYLNRH